jgi:hypothetical protein
MYGLSPTSDKTVSYQDWARQVHPDDLPHQQAALKRLAWESDRRREPGLVVHERRLRDFRISRPDGTTRHGTAPVGKKELSR